MRAGRSQVFYFALAIVVLFFIAGVGSVGFTVAGLRKRVPVTVLADYDMPISQVEQFVKTAANRLEWRQVGQDADDKAHTSTFHYSGPDPESPLPRQVPISVTIGPSAVKPDAAAVRIVGLTKAVKPLRALLDEQLPGVEPPAKP